MVTIANILLFDSRSAVSRGLSLIGKCLNSRNICRLYRSHIGLDALFESACYGSQA